MVLAFSCAVDDVAATQETLDNSTTSEIVGDLENTVESTYEVNTSCEN